MASVLHIIDATCRETQLRVLDALRSRLAADGHRQAVCSVDGAMAAHAERCWRSAEEAQWEDVADQAGPIAGQANGQGGGPRTSGRLPVGRTKSAIPGRSGEAVVAPCVAPVSNRCADDTSSHVAGGAVADRVWRAERRVQMLHWAPRLAAVARQVQAQITHAWGIEAAAVCNTVLPDLPAVLTLLDPPAARDSAKWLRSFPTDAVVVTGSQAARRSLISAGMAPERVVVIRGAVDFAAINRARQAGLRGALLGDAWPVLLLQDPLGRDGGHVDGIWAAAVLRLVFPRLRVIVPCARRVGQRLLRLAENTRMPQLAMVPDARLTWAELVTCADVFVAPVVDDVCAEPMATAMAAGLIVVAAAVRSVAELVWDGRTGLLYKPGEHRALAQRILTAVEDQGLRSRVTDAARAHVYEVCSMRVFVDNYARLYSNMLAGRPPSEGISDAATWTQDGVTCGVALNVTT